MSQSSELGTSSGGLNTGDNHSDSFLEALCGLRLPNVSLAFCNIDIYINKYCYGSI